MNVARDLPKEVQNSGAVKLGEGSTPSFTPRR